MSLSREHEFLLVADEVYHFLSYAGDAPRPFAADAKSGNVISLGSFSKILAPGLRLGWMQTDEKNMQRFIKSGLLDSGGGMNPFTSAIVRQALENGSLDQNISKLRAIYRQRVSIMDDILHQTIPQAEYSVPKGGYFFWIQLPNRINTMELQQRAKDFKVGFRPGALFSCQNGMKDHVRLSFVFYEPDQLEQGILRLKRCLENFEY